MKFGFSDSPFKFAFVLAIAVGMTVNAAYGESNHIPVLKEFRLVGSHVTGSGEPMAIIENVRSNEQDVFSEATHVFGSVKLLKIEEDKLIVSKNGRLSLILDKKGIRASSGDVSRSNGFASSYRTAIGAGAAYNRARLSNANHVAVDAVEMRAKWKRVPHSLLSARPQPVFENGKVIGLELGEMTDDNLLVQVGLRSGDVVKSLNGVAIIDPTQTFSELDSMYKSGTAGFNLVIERDGVEQELNITAH